MRTKRSELTRERIFAAALRVFRSRGFERATMREVARAAKMSLGAAYYYYPSKEAIVLAYYERISLRHEQAVGERLARASGLRDRLAAVYHSHVELIAGDRELLGALARGVADVRSPLSVFAAETRPVRERALAGLRSALDVPDVPVDLREEAALGLWLLQLAFTLYLVWDDSPEQARTRRLIDDVLDLLVPAVPLFASPFGAPLRASLRETLERAGLWPN